MPAACFSSSGQGAEAAASPQGALAAGISSWELLLGSAAFPHSSAATSLPSPAGDPWPGCCQRGKQLREAEINPFCSQIPPPCWSTRGCEVISQAPLALHKCSRISLLVMGDEELKIGACSCFDGLGLMQELWPQMWLEMLPFTSVAPGSTEMIIFSRRIENRSYGVHKRAFLRVIFYLVFVPFSTLNPLASQRKGGCK